MNYEGIEFSVRAGLGRNEWVVTIHFPDASELLTRSSVVKVTGTRDEAIALTQDRIRNWRKRQKLKARATTETNLIQMNRTSYRSASLFQSHLLHATRMTGRSLSESR